MLVSGHLNTVEPQLLISDISSILMHMNGSVIDNGDKVAGFNPWE